MPASEVASAMYASDGVIASDPTAACRTNTATADWKFQARLNSGITHAESVRPSIISRRAPQLSASLPYSGFSIVVATAPAPNSVPMRDGATPRSMPR